MKMVMTAKKLMVAGLVATLAMASPGCLTTKSVANTASFGLIGNKQKIADEKAQKQQHDQEKKEADQKAYAEKQAAKRAKEDAKEAKKDNTAAPIEKSEPEKEKRGFWSKATFGLVGWKKEKPEKTETKTAEPATPKNDKQAAKEAKKQEERDREAAKKQAKAAKKALEKQAKADREQAKKDAKAADTQVAAAPTDTQTTAAPTDTKAAASESEQPKHKRSFMSRATFGLIGGSGEKEKQETKVEEKETKKEKAHKEEKPVEAAPVKTAEAAQPAVETPAEPVTPVASEHRGVAHLPFRTAVSTVNQTASGLPKIVASRRTYSSNGYGITDIGDVRIAVKGMTFSDETRADGVVIQSDERGVAAGKSGKGNEGFAFEYNKGVTTCTFGSVQFTVSKAVLSVDGHDVPIGKGRRVIVLNDSGKVDAVYNIG